MSSTTQINAPFWRQGVVAGLARSRRFIWFLLKTVLPLYVATEILKVTGILSWASGFLGPVMSWWGLPPEAAAALLAGFVLNMMAGVAVAAPLGLSPAQVSVLGLMLGICHALLIEGAIVSGLAPGKTLQLTIFRIGLALLAGLALARILM